MKDKYIDAEYPFWFELGGLTDTDGRDLNDPKIAMEQHNRCQRRLVECAQAFEQTDREAFYEFWYGDSE